MNNYFIKNLETGKIELHFDKETYQALSFEQKKEIKSNFLWSNFIGAWVSRSSKNTYWPEQIANKLGLTNNGEEGQRLTFEQQLEIKTEKAESRAERFETRSEKLSKESNQAFTNAREMTKCIPMGQPILVGHHSEKGHRRLLEKSDNKMRKGFELQNKSEYYEDRARAANITANQSQLKSPVYLNNRIKELNAEIRRLNRILNEGVKPEGDYLKRLNDLKSQAEDKLSFFQKALETLGGVKYTKENLKDAKNVKYRGTWYPIKRLNPLTVTIGDWFRPGAGTWKIPYAAIQEINKEEKQLG
jgi:hypothetical protein